MSSLHLSVNSPAAGRAPRPAAKGGEGSIHPQWAADNPAAKTLADMRFPKTERPFAGQFRACLAIRFGTGAVEGMGSAGIAEDLHLLLIDRRLHLLNVADRDALIVV